jgi:hypothetical protein
MATRPAGRTSTADIGSSTSTEWRHSSCRLGTASSRTRAAGLTRRSQFASEGRDSLGRERGVAKCVVALDGTLTDCSAIEADPEGLGFSEAVVKLVSTMRMDLWSRDGAPVDGATVVLGVTLNLKAQQ